MQYSFERWDNVGPDVVEASGTLPDGLPVDSVVQPFPFSEDLKELEAGLSLDLEEGLESFRQYQKSNVGATESAIWNERPDAPQAGEASDWDELAKLVAEHVMAYMTESPLQTELDILRAKLDEYYRDNRTMADHVQRLVEENEALRVSVSACELELATFRNVIGNVYLKH